MELQRPVVFFVWYVASLFSVGGTAVFRHSPVLGLVLGAFALVATSVPAIVLVESGRSVREALSVLSGEAWTGFGAWLLASSTIAVATFVVGFFELHALWGV